MRRLPEKRQDIKPPAGIIPLFAAALAVLVALVVVMWVVIATT